MGFRSSIVSTDHDWPQWFRDKWTWLRVPESGVLSVNVHQKFYSATMEDLCTDVQTTIGEDACLPVVLVLLHECGGVTRYEITLERINITEPSGWEPRDMSSHSYCECWSAPILEDINRWLSKLEAFVEKASGATNEQ